ncbi:MAG: hypothetical protein J6J67_09825 [Treponema sp.]|nr:hypothetical protein [Treponema sp.]
MRKALGILLSIILIWGFISCQQPTNSSDDFANQNPTEQPKNETTDKGENEKEEIPPVVEGEEETEEEILLNLGLTKTYSMLIGETVNLASMIDDSDVWYEVQTGNDVIEVDGNTITAISVGTATLKATDWEDESRTWKCVVTVSAEGFTGTALEYKLIGKWYYGDSYIELNSDKTGYMKVFLNSSMVQDSTFNWCGREVNTNKYLSISNGSSEINRDYTILKVSEVEFRIKGYLGFGLPEETTWVKE